MIVNDDAINSGANLETPNMNAMAPGNIIFNQPLARFTSWRVGGTAEKYFRPKDLADLAATIKSIPDNEPLLFLGLGSNTLIRDGGFKGTVIHLFKCINNIHIIDDDSELESLQSNLDKDTLQENKKTGELLVSIEAGVTCAKIAKFCEKNNLVGGEFFAGIPGTMGGALAMNAGAFGSDTWSLVKKVKVINRQGEVYFRSPKDFKVGYRSIENLRSNQEYFVGAYLNFPLLKHSDSSLDNHQDASGNEKVKALLKKRNTSQPIGSLSCGSVFRNPPGDYAAKLIEASKLKGKRIGDAIVSDKHANFIINLGNATSNDIEELINLVKSTVLRDHGIKLDLEAKIFGEYKES